MFRVQAVSTGWTGAPGVNTFYFGPTPATQDGADLAYARVRALFTSLRGILAKSVVVHVVPEIDEFEVTNGNVTRTFAVTPAADITGNSLQTGLAPPGLALLGQYKSADFISGRRVQGHSFFSPCGPYQLETDGTPSAEAVQTVHDSLEALRTADDLFAEWAIWSRPRKAGSGKKGNLTARDGSYHKVISVSCPNKWSQLRSRRD